jgi:hypothetical protein
MSVCVCVCAREIRCARMCFSETPHASESPLTFAIAGDDQLYMLAAYLFYRYAPEKHQDVLRLSAARCVCVCVSVCVCVCVCV